MTETQTVVLNSGRERDAASAIVRPLSLPASIAHVADERYQPRSTSGFVPSGWVPPPWVSPQQAVAINDFLEQLLQSCAPADESLVHQELAVLAVCLQLEDLPSSAWQMRQEALLDDIRDLAIPADIVAVTSRTLRRTKRFYPLNSEFLDVALLLWRERKALLRRLEILCCVAEYPAPDGEVTIEWYREILSMADQCGQTWRERGAGPQPIGAVVEDLGGSKAAAPAGAQ